MFKRILIANRGEIACRIIRTCRRLGIETVAVYSDADAHALHVSSADQAVRIGPAEAGKSYLSIDAIIKTCRTSAAEAVHPGYGFLSENPSFVEALEKAGISFIGPPASAISAMGLKDAAKARVEGAGVPVVPGYHGPDQSPALLKAEAQKIGTPLLIKARAGGGGKGMRLVENLAAFDEALESARAEAAKSFGDDAVLLERYVTNPRHVEIQIMADRHGNTVHLFERDCSLQRRHQKVIEEAPAPDMPEEVRRAMGDAAVRAAKAVGYVGAGTVEFIADGSDGLKLDGFFFMEMNTRLQVEHPVTEAITGLDLVEWQIRVAAGEPLPFAQDDLRIDGHSFEARLYAEDVPRGFLPATGELKTLVLDDTAARIDTGVRQGDRITPFYDPMIAKIITHGVNRRAALKKLENALQNSFVAGTTTNLSFLLSLCRHEGFRNGDVDTGLIARDLDDLTTSMSPTPEDWSAAAILSVGIKGDGFRLWGPRGSSWQTLIFGDQSLEWRITLQDDGCYNCRSGELEVTIETPEAFYTLEPGRITIGREGRILTFQIPDPLDADMGAGASDDQIRAPMPGSIREIRFKEGDMVRAGQTLVIMEAMKMELAIKAPHDGIVEALLADAGSQVEADTVLIRLGHHDGG